MMFPPIVHVALENKGSLDAVGLLAGAAFGAALRSRARYMLITAQSDSVILPVLQSRVRWLEHNRD